MNESFPRILYNCPKVDSMKALEAPNSAMTHIQKNSSGTADSDGGSHSRKISRTYTAGDRDSECLKRRYMFLSLLPFARRFA